MKRYLAVLLALCLMLSLMAGCGSKPEEPVPTEEPAASAEEPTSAPEAPEEEPNEETPDVPEERVQIQYPLEEGGTLKVWMEFQMNLSFFVDTIADIPIEAELQKAIGVNLEYDEVSMSVVQEVFSLAVASGDMADIISGGVSKYTAGLDHAVNENIYIDLLPYLPECAPDYWEMLNADPSYLKDATTDEGRIVGVYNLYADEPVPATGLVIRGDLLEKANLDVPETYEELEEVFKAFQTQGIAHPMYSCFGMNSFVSSGYDVSGYAFFAKDGEIKFSVVEDGYKQYIQMLHDWNAQGFYSDDWLSLNNPMVDAAVVNGEAGVFEQSTNRLPQILANMADPNATIIPIPEPVQEKGQQRHFSNVDKPVVVRAGATVTTSCENVELALKYLNYFYTEPGIIAFNYGSEGVSYVLDESGKPQFTDLILNNPDGLTSNQALDYYTYNGYAGKVIMNSVQAMFFNETQHSCAEVWGENNDSDYIISPSVTLNAAEADVYNGYYSDIETLVDEQLTKFIVGDTDMSEYDAFVEQIKGMNLDEVLEAYQSAYDRYLVR